MYTHTHTPIHPYTYTHTPIHPYAHTPRPPDPHTPIHLYVITALWLACLTLTVQGSLEWFENNGMKLNSSKCHLLVCGHKYECMLCDVRHSEEIEKHKVKLLGVWIDSDLSFDDHMSNICGNAAKKLYALSRQCDILPFSRRKMLIKFFRQFTIFSLSTCLDEP